MERGHLQNSDVNRSHEPIGIPLNRPPGTFSPTGGEGWDEGERFMESQKAWHNLSEIYPSTTLRISPFFNRVFSRCPAFTSAASRITLPVAASVVLASPRSSTCV